MCVNKLPHSRSELGLCVVINILGVLTLTSRTVSGSYFLKEIVAVFIYFLCKGLSSLLLCSIHVVNNWTPSLCWLKKARFLPCTHTHKLYTCPAIKTHLKHTYPPKNPGNCSSPPTELQFPEPFLGFFEICFKYMVCMHSYGKGICKGHASLLSVQSAGVCVKELHAQSDVRG